MPHRFSIAIKDGYKTKRYTVEYIPVNDLYEQFRLHGRNKTVVLQSNRPLFRNKGIKRRPAQYRVIEGDVAYLSALDPFIKEINNFIDSGKNIPVKFKSNGKTVQGMLSKVAGGGSTVLYHLEVDNFHWGQLMLISTGWRFTSNTNPELESQAEYFGSLTGIEKPE